ncbi:hypothetical protein ACFFU8_09210 [Chromobacterium piscinae]|nr:hypothetical protein [Chromobacterium piscinae]MCD5327918.1 hypothetical protein [Chromobacterium piscinae]
MKRIIIAPLMASLLATGCSTNYRQQAGDLHKNATEDYEKAKAASKSEEPLIVLRGEQPLSFEKLSDEAQEAKQRAWLRRMQLTYVPKYPVSAFEILKVFRDHGINVTSSLPLDSYMYGGHGVRSVNGEIALQVLLGAMGLDYEVDDNSHVVEIIPMKSQTWSINIGNRTTSFNTATLDPSGNSTSSTTSSSSSSATAAPSSMTPSGYGIGAQQGSSGSSGSNAGSNGNTISSNDNFWGSLKTELAGRLSILVPANKAASSAPTPAAGGATQVPGFNSSMQRGMPGTAMGGAGMADAEGGSDLFVTQKVGRYQVNPETGAVTVQAPRWLMKGLARYLDDVQSMYNTQITFEGRIISVTSREDQSEGFDIAGLGKFAAGRYGAVLSNNILGGATISLPTAGSNIPSVTIGNSALPGSSSLFGISSPLDGLQIFNAYLTTQQNVETTDKPLVSTTSGTPVEFGQMTTSVRIKYDQEVSGGSATTSSIVATKNVEVPYQIGSVLRINPRYDVSSGIIRAQVSLQQKILQGSVDTVQVVTAGDKIQQIPGQIPLIKDQVNTGEAVLKDGDLIVLGGLSSYSNSDTSSGITGLKDIAALGGFFGKVSRSKTKTTTYFVLKVSITKRGG